MTGQPSFVSTARNYPSLSKVDRTSDQELYSDVRHRAQRRVLAPSLVGTMVVYCVAAACSCVDHGAL